jgi:glycerol-3-phosphate dehydrogenase (NAD(P)+)
MSVKLGIVGAGAWGKALFSMFSKKFNGIVLYSRNSSGTQISNKLEDVANLDYIFLVIPAQEVKDFCSQLKEHLSANTKIVVCSKGIENSSGQLISGVVGEIFPDNVILIMSGPNFATEISENLPSVSSIACQNIDIAKKAAAELSTDNFKLYPTDDIIAVSLYGALKNVLAITCGMVRGLDLGENFIAAVITKGVNEIALLSRVKGGKDSTIFEPACIGDVFLTCNSTTSRNTKFGMDLARKYLNKDYKEIIKEEKNTVEGMHTALSLHSYYNNINIPLLKLAYYVMSNKIDSQDVLTAKIKSVVLA